MYKKQVVLYNMIFPIALLRLFPPFLLVILPLNFIIDLTVVLLTIKFLKLDDIKAKKIILKVWLLGFLADIIGSLFILLSVYIDRFLPEEQGEWWYRTVSLNAQYSPFENILSLIWVLVAVAISFVCIFYFNYKISLKNMETSDTNKKKLSLSLAIFTAPYTLLIPIDLFM